MKKLRLLNKVTRQITIKLNTAKYTPLIDALYVHPSDFPKPLTNSEIVGKSLFFLFWFRFYDLGDGTTLHDNMIKCLEKHGIHEKDLYGLFISEFRKFQKNGI